MAKEGWQFTLRYIEININFRWQVDVPRLQYHMFRQNHMFHLSRQCPPDLTKAFHHTSGFVSKPMIGN